MDSEKTYVVDTDNLRIIDWGYYPVDLIPQDQTFYRLADARRMLRAHVERQIATLKYELHTGLNEVIERQLYKDDPELFADRRAEQDARMTELPF